MTQTKLKLIAVVSMLLDHTAKILVASGALYPYLDAKQTAVFYDTLVVAGRAAFPIFAWFIAEGCRRTHAPARYLTRLLLFAVISEIPFQYCFYGAAYAGLQPGCHNVMFTFFLAAAAIFFGNKAEQLASVTLRHVLPGCVALVLGWLLYTDYNAWGIALVLGLYYLPEKKHRLIYLCGWNVLFYLIWHGLGGGTIIWLTAGGVIQLFYFVGAILSVPLLALYNGQQGRRLKWLFYTFYPLHLGVLYMISIALQLL